jgi:PTH1 family peptidyl-tRNA hydrolase
MDRLFELLRPTPEAAPSAAPYLIVGLGNPGREYRNTRHNIGFLLLDQIAAQLGVTFSRLEMKALVTKGETRGARLILAKPQTFMNLSGTAVGPLLNYYKVPHTQLLVVYDDVDLPAGSLRLRPSGGSAGQKGMASIIERLGTQEFARLRLGIGRPPGRMDAAAYVLQEFSKAESEALQMQLQRAAEAVLTFVHDGLNEAMNRYNGSEAGG